MRHAGSASRGLYRVHQFSKVEMFVLCTPAQSDAMLQELCDLEERMFSQLGLHFRMMVLPARGTGSWVAAWLSRKLSRGAA